MRTLALLACVAVGALRAQSRPAPARPGPGALDRPPSGTGQRRRATVGDPDDPAYRLARATAPRYSLGTAGPGLRPARRDHPRRAARHRPGLRRPGRPQPAPARRLD